MAILLGRADPGRPALRGVSRSVPRGRQRWRRGGARAPGRAEGRCPPHTLTGMGVGARSWTPGRPDLPGPRHAAHRRLCGPSQGTCPAELCGWAGRARGELALCLVSLGAEYEAAAALRVVMSLGATLCMISADVDVLVTSSGPQREIMHSFKCSVKCITSKTQPRRVYFAFKHFPRNYVTTKYTVTQS